MGQHALHLARADHTRFVNDEHILGSQLLAPFAPLMLKAGDGARCDAGAVFQTLGGNAGQGCATHIVARAFPCLARHAQHRAFAGPGIANDHGKATLLGDILEGGFLLA